MKEQKMHHSMVVQQHFDMEIHGTLCRPAILMVGTWDPFLPYHEALLHHMSDHARTNGYDAAVVMLDPPPAKFLPGKWCWPYFDDVAVRVARLQGCGVSVIHAQFEREHLLLGAAEIFDALLTVTAIAEVWIGARQSLGRGHSGDYQKIESLGNQYGFKVTRLPALDTTHDQCFQARTFLLEGKVESARAIVGHAPTFARPVRAEPITLAWPAGAYQVVSLPSIDAPLHGSPISVTLQEV
jgi:FAD synthase